MRLRLALVLALLVPASALAQGPPVNQAPFFGYPTQQGSSSNPFTNISFTGQALGGDGSASAPTYSFTSEPGLGWYRGGSGAMAMAESGAVRFYFGGSTGSVFSQGSGGTVVWSSTSAASGTSDLILGRESAAVLQMGVDAAGVTNQMFKGPDRITSDGVGGNLTIAGGRNRGASAGGSLIFQTSPAAGAGVTGTLTTALTIDSTGLATFASGISTPTVSTTGNGIAVTASGAYFVDNQRVISATEPTVPVACTSPTVTWATGTAAFQIDVGSTCAGISTLVVTMPAAANAWMCSATNTTTSATAAVEMTASTSTSATFTNYTRTTGIALAWVDGADIRISCLGG